MTNESVSKEEKRSDTLGLKIRKARENLNISIEEFSISIDVNISTMRKYESGVRRPTIETLIIISNFFGLSLDYLLRDEIHEEIYFNKNCESKAREQLRENVYKEVKEEFLKSFNEFYSQL